MQINAAKAELDDAEEQLIRRTESASVQSLAAVLHLLQILIFASHAHSG